MGALPGGKNTAEQSTPNGLTPAPRRYSDRVLRQVQRISVRHRLYGIAAVAVLLLVAVGAIARHGLNELSQARQGATALAGAQKLELGAYQLTTELQAKVYYLLLARSMNDPEGIADAQSDIAQTQAELTRVRRDLRELDLLPPATRFVTELDADIDVFVLRMQLFTAQPSSGGLVASTYINAFEEEAVHRLTGHLRQVNTALSALESAAEQRAETARRQAGAQIVLACVASALLLGLLSALVSASLLNGVRGILRVAHRIRAGELDARVGQTLADDDIGALGRAFDDTADAIRNLLHDQAIQARRDSFSRRLGNAFDMASYEPEALKVVGAALAEVVGDRPGELRLADSSQAHMELAVSTPGHAEPGCPVPTPYGCPAIRRGGPQRFDASTDLDACPHLRDRSVGPISAVCAPVTFMGRSLGVLHVTGPVGEGPRVEHEERLASLAASVGARIGTIRSFERSELQASTDGLTGLLNRRDFESRTRRLLAQGREFTLVLADLDHFKRLNDTHGHQAGDRALKLYADVLRRHVREGDLAARYGGEEFVCLLIGADVEQALGLVGRLQSHLALAVIDAPPAFTASYGIAVHLPGSTLDTTLHAADSALYRAKHEGRDRAVVAGTNAHPTPESAPHDETHPPGLADPRLAP